MDLDAIKANQERARLAKPQHAGSKWVTHYRDDVASLLTALEVNAAMYEQSEARVARLERVEKAARAYLYAEWSGQAIGSEPLMRVRAAWQELSDALASSEAPS